MPTPGSRFGNYLLHEKLAVGGMGELYLATAVGAAPGTPPCVLKILLEEYLTDPSFVSMFHDEARIGMQLAHANIVGVQDVGRVGEIPYFVLEYVHGENLRRVLRELSERGERLPIELAIRLTIEVLHALDHAHRARDAKGRDLHLVHRDLSPDNVMISFDGDVKVLDFGIAKADGRETKTQFGILKGKAQYMSPEQALGQEVDARTDLYAVGLVLLEMITGERRFAIDAEPVQMIRDARTWVPKGPSESDPRLPVELDAIVLKALLPEPERRWQTADEFASVLTRLLRENKLPRANENLPKLLRRLFPDRAEPFLMVDRGDASETQPAVEARPRREPAESNAAMLNAEETLDDGPESTQTSQAFRPSEVSETADAIGDAPAEATMERSTTSRAIQVPGPPPDRRSRIAEAMEIPAPESTVVVPKKSEARANGDAPRVAGRATAPRAPRPTGVVGRDRGPSRVVEEPPDEPTFGGRKSLASTVREAEEREHTHARIQMLPADPPTRRPRRTPATVPVRKKKGGALFKVFFVLVMVGVTFGGATMAGGVPPALLDRLPPSLRALLAPKTRGAARGTVPAPGATNGTGSDASTAPAGGSTAAGPTAAEAEKGPSAAGTAANPFALATSVPSPTPAPPKFAAKPPVGPTAARTPAVRKGGAEAADPTKVSVRILSTPPGLEVLVDGKGTGRKTPTTVQFDAGPRVLSIEAAGYRPWTFEETFAPGMTLMLRADLQKGP